ncbi:unnamed protein product [Alternaria burnsii]|nr:unnamed protein product [Alternaria burnsii]
MNPFAALSAFANRFNRTIHITQAILVLGAFITGCALLADSSMPRGRSTTLVLVYSIKSALFLLYQYLTTHVDRFRRFGSPRLNFFLDALDCLLWFTAFIISCMGGKRCVGSSCTTVGIAATFALLLSVSYFITSIGISWPKWRESKKLQHVEQV